jgi:hypothetical protein
MTRHKIRISIFVFIAAVALLVTSFLLPYVPAQAADTPEYWAVIVGITDYQYINDTYYAADNAEETYEIFSPAWGVDHTQLLTDSQATKADILGAIAWMASNANPEDTVLFVFSGHGDTGGYICPYDTYIPDDTMISATELANAFMQVKANKIAIILDSCYSGAFRSALSGIGRVVLLATTPYELGWETSALHNSVFIYFLLEAIENYDSTDTNHNLELSAEELFYYAGPKTSNYEILNLFESIQHPVLDDRYPGELSLLAIFALDINIDIPADVGIFTLDGANYPLVSGTHFLIPGVMHTLTVPQIVDPGSGTRYVFASWSDGETTYTRLISKGTYGVNYDKEQLLTITSAYGDINGDGWYKDGVLASFSITRYVETSDTRHYFTGWSGDFTGEYFTGTLIMDSPKTVIANWRHEYLLSLDSAYGSLAGAGWYSEGSIAEFSVTPDYIETSDTRRYFTGWSGDYTGPSLTVSLVINSPKTMTANWRSEYLLTVNSEYDEPTGAGWYNEGDVASVSLTQEEGFLVRHHFIGWSGDVTGLESSINVTMDSPKVITALWQTDYTYLYILISIVVVAGVVIVTIIVLIRRKRATPNLPAANPPPPPPPPTSGSGMLK